MKLRASMSRVVVLFLTMIFLGIAIVFEIIELTSLPAQFFGTLLGVVITAIITVLLLQGQTKSEESRERNLMVFEKKQEVFYHFLTQLNIILQKENLTLNLSHEKALERDVNSLQDLLFEFGFLQMHTSAETFDEILNLVGNLMEESKKIKHIKEKNEKDFEIYYKVLVNDFFAIASLLRLELYNSAPTNVDKTKLDCIIKLSF